MPKIQKGFCLMNHCCHCLIASVRQVYYWLRSGGWDCTPRAKWYLRLPCNYLRSHFTFNGSLWNASRFWHVPRFLPPCLDVLGLICKGRLNRCMWTKADKGERRFDCMHCRVADVCICNTAANFWFCQFRTPMFDIWMLMHPVSIIMSCLMI